MLIFLYYSTVTRLFNLKIQITNQTHPKLQATTLMSNSQRQNTEVYKPARRVTFDMAVSEREMSNMTITCDKKRKRRSPSRGLIRSVQEHQQYMQRQRRRQGISGFKSVFLRRVCKQYMCFKVGFEQWTRVVNGAV